MREPRPLLARMDALVQERERVQERVPEAERDWLELQMEEWRTLGRCPTFSCISCRGSRSRPAAVSACSEGTTSMDCGDVPTRRMEVTDMCNRCHKSFQVYKFLR